MEDDERGSYILNSRDLNLMPRLGEYLSLGIDSLKVEGRNKSDYYVAVVARAYRAAIDAWYADPENFDADPYLRELASVPSRGYTLGFHTGRLENTGHNFHHGASLSAFEFAGSIREWDGDDLIMEVKNRLLPGDVIEILPPGSIDNIRVRLYEFEDSKNRKISDKFTSGAKRAIRIRREQLHSENIEELKAQIPPGTVVRKARPLTSEQETILKQNNLTQEVETGLLPAESLLRTEEQSVALRGAIRKTKPPRMGEHGCCGLGCNGCLPFWQDPKYEKARQLLRTKKGLPKLNRTLLDQALSAE
ncbi:MAG: U32 family peptidase C-terminal domain-containing protein [Polyangiaceae bacterium]|nr:U32 family peptidase C-terminal domain-containing protein [Polyangiaceae bacterium]